MELPKRIELNISENPFPYKGRILQMNKGYTEADFRSNTILTDDVFTYIEFFFMSHSKRLKYRNSISKEKYGSEKKYQYLFYWKQAKIFYYATKSLPIESIPLLSYYSMLNATKALLSYKIEYIEDFVEHFATHGLFEDKYLPGNDLCNIAVGRKMKGVFPLFGKYLEENFDAIWPSGNKHTITLNKLLYNLAYIHRSYITTYTTSRSPKVPELFIPLKPCFSPCYYKGNDGNLYLIINIDKKHFSSSPSSIPSAYVSSISDEFQVSKKGKFLFRSTNGAKRNSTDSLSSEFKILNKKLRREFQYIHSEKRLWYLRRSKIGNENFLDMNSMLVTMAAMHRISEIVRYKPEQLAHLMESKENWLIHEFITLALNQFIDEIASEITGQDIMETGIKY